MTEKLNLIGMYRLEESDLYKQGEDIHLRAGTRQKTRKGVGVRYLGRIKGDGEEEEFKYISSLYPTRNKNSFKLDYNGKFLELEIKNAGEVEIKEYEPKPQKMALVYRGAK